MADQYGNWQWTMDVVIWHDQSFGHQMTVTTQTKGRDGRLAGTWNWKGLGVPEDLVYDMEARLIGILTEHLVSRYGVAGELPLKWAGEPDPF